MAGAKKQFHVGLRQVHVVGRNLDGNWRVFLFSARFLNQMVALNGALA